MAYEEVGDSSNPFAKEGLSKEVRALLDFVVAARKTTGADIVCTSTTDHPVKTNSGGTSRHRQQGTDGLGLAVDLRLRTRGTGKNHHRVVFDVFTVVEKQLHELIYAYAPYKIKGGKQVAPYAVSGHKDHVHVSVNKGVLVRYPGVVTPPSQPPQPAVHEFTEDQMKSTTLTIPVGLNGEGWAPWNPGLGRAPVIVGIVQQGPYPPVDGYWSDSAGYNFSGQTRGVEAIITVRRAKPNTTAVCFVTVA